MGSSRRQRILLVDDSSEIREAFALVLEEAGYEVASVRTFEGALASLRSKRPDLVLTDTMLLGPGGLELISRIQRDFAAPALPVIACSGFGDFKDEALSRGAVTFLPKPVEIGDLLHAVEKALGGQAPGKELLERLERRSALLRRQASEAAAAALEANGPRKRDLMDRAQRGVQWIAGYLQFGNAAVLLYEDGVLQVKASASQEGGRPELRDSRWVALARDVVESRSSLLLSDTHAHLPFRGGAMGPIRLFIGIPLIGPGLVAIGAICVFGEQPIAVEAEDLAILEDLGRRASAAIRSDVAMPRMPFFGESTLLTRETLGALIRIELARAERTDSVVELAAFDLLPGVRVQDAARAVEAATSPHRRAIAELGEHRIGLLLARSSASEAQRELTRATGRLLRELGFEGAGILSVESRGLPPPGAEQLLPLAETIAARNARAREAGIERLLIRGERWPPAYEYEARDADQDASQRPPG